MTTRPAKPSFFMSFLNKIEYWGNKLPDPVMIFIGLCIITIIASALLSAMDVTAFNPVTKETVHVINLLTIDGLTQMITKATTNFTQFPALGVVLVVMFGIGVAEHSGYFRAVMIATVEKAPIKLIMPVLILVAMLGTVAGDASQIVVPPLAAMIFVRLGYHPIAGLVMAYAAALGAFAANTIIGMADALALSFTEASLKTINVDIPVNIAMNWYFMTASMFLLLFVILFVTQKIIIPRLGEYTPEHQEEAVNDLTIIEKKGLKWANLSLLTILVAITVLAIPESSFLRNPESGSLIDGPLIQGVAIVIAIIFFIPGFIYAAITKKARNSKDIVEMMNRSMAGMSSFIVIVFFSAQMIALFAWSNLGLIIAIKGASLLENQNGFTLIIGFIIITSIINIFIGSASAKWALLAPIFVPMFLFLGYHPAFTQAIYRVGDSITNPITPMMAYLPLLLSFAKKYDKNMGLGTLISNLFPYSLALGIVWTLFVLIWYWFGLPVGPGGPIFLEQKYF
ncbi:AbgT family transporter [Ignatzschineria rhizosphaerae]|uniref:AbgT family transporter n=1 Tax=Ignatzschineria rhizosphaerae TaxID=2923279 RepID=A0ABY3X659_9GAMM|nr:AbgT family transporter [Ignatzschineria rhizosphaerae]UNM97234.1 AbgT family transporter [Ignatzschineria rhizosphaerae]